MSIRGISIPFEVELTSNIAELSAAVPFVFIATPWLKIFRLPKRKTQL